jgi:antitoxin CcdA
MRMAPRKPVNLSLDAALLAEARSLDLNLSGILEESLRARLRAARAEAWRRENAAAIRAANEELAANGLWSDGLRLF